MLDTFSLFIIGLVVFLYYYFFRRDESKQLSSNQKSSGSSNFNYNTDRFKTLDEVTDAVREAGLESSNLMFAVDFTKSNLWQGKSTFSGRCLHHIQEGRLNPYQQVISILGRTLSPFDDDGLIPAYGFGDASTGDWGSFPLSESGLCAGFPSVLEAYSHVAPRVQLSGPTNFAPVIRQAIQIVAKQRRYHILVIVADGQVTQEADTRAAIVEASQYPISIIVIGVGDGPWDMMERFDDTVQHRLFDNFQFVDYVKATATARNPDASFAMHALMEVPDQYAMIRKLGLLESCSTTIMGPSAPPIGFVH